MISKIFSVELHGLDGFLVEIEVDKRGGIPKFIIVGLPDTAVQEAKERVRSAIRNSGFEFPRPKVIVNLAPANLKKMGPRYDLAIALGVLKMMGYLKSASLNETAIIGELALNGNIRPIHGVLSTVEFARSKGFKKILLPAENAKEAALINGIKILPARTLKEAVQFLNSELEPLPVKPKANDSSIKIETDLKLVRGQTQAKRALEIAAAGGHNLLLCGAPGAGKTLMAKALRGILPPMTEQEKLEVTKIYSISGLLPTDNPLIETRPFRTIHHTASAVSIVGGGNQPGPGEISLAHRGVLFMDEIAEFPRPVLEVLRQPIENRTITVSRARGTYIYPCEFSLIASMNPCPCGYRNVEGLDKECRCQAYEIQRYQKKLSGPMLDRMDMLININPVDPSKLTGGYQSESSDEVRKRVVVASQIQQKRFDQKKVTKNSEMKNEEIHKHCKLDSASNKLLQTAISQFNLSARGYFRILKLARTIADLDQSKSLKPVHIAEALQYRIKIF